MEKHVPVAVPAGPLPHKNWIMPEIGTAPYPGRDEGSDDLDNFTVRHFGSYRGLYEYCQKSRIEGWAKTVREYEADPHRAGTAWRYLDAHPAFYKFRMDEEVLLSDILQERNLEHDFGLTRIYYRLGEWCSEQWDCDEEQCPHSKADIHYFELGGWSWPSDKEPGDPNPRPGLYGSHDYELDVYGSTYEECVVQAAYLVWQKYGSDRRIVDGDG